jgi:hypothetical protein
MQYIGLLSTVVFWSMSMRCFNMGVNTLNMRAEDVTRRLGSSHPREFGSDRWRMLTRHSSPDRYTSLFLQGLEVISRPRDGGLTVSLEAADRRPQAGD